MEGAGGEDLGEELERLLKGARSWPLMFGVYEEHSKGDKIVGFFFFSGLVLEVGF